MVGQALIRLAVIVLDMLLLLAPVADAAVIYHSGHGERDIIVDLPLSSTTTINKTVHIDAPAGATVIYTDTPVYPAVSPYPHYPNVLPYPPVRPSPSSISLRPVEHVCLRTAGVYSAWQPVMLDSCSNGEISEAMYFQQGQIWLNSRCLAVRNNAVGTVSCAPNRENNWLLTGRQLRDRNSDLCVDGEQGRLLLQPCRDVTSQQFH
ncbi:ricin-type beta-trefoil lectin domain protein [Snodgrassella communis]|uniref:ricin-type beta-trefoil lectin domain protein n=1 Tax=Snodgrassella communis TaxID=2946699 RepID=UPI00286C1AE5|nr:ricin-type beta-trefoil lectin domain protein [Snodgrassella communis]WMY90898.1 ricin-type beta-trefoil lectin domain protein [Snodgrassella communis]